MRALLDRGADVRTQDKEKRSPLVGAARGGHADAVELLVGRGAPVSMPSPLAIYEEVRGSLVVRFFLSSVPNILLVAAAEGGSADAVRALARHGATQGETRMIVMHALEHACNAEVVWALADVASHVFVAAADAALSTIAKNGRVAALRAVLDACADLPLLSGAYALRLAAQNNQAECVAALLDAGVSNTWDAVIDAAERGHAKCVSLLVERGLTENQKSQLLTVACESKRSNVMQVLLEAGAEPYGIDPGEALNLLKCGKEVKRT